MPPRMMRLVPEFVRVACTLYAPSTTCSRPRWCRWKRSPLSST